MQRLDMRDTAVLDIGCGSGVLSVAAVVLGAARVEAIDVEPGAVAATIVNAERNDVADRIRARVATVDDVADDFDVVLANVVASVHRVLAGGARARARGFLIVSGMLDGQVTDVESAYGAMRVASLTDDGFSKLLAAGLTFGFALQTFIIVGGVLRIIPLTGITLPFVSYGGSSVVANFVLLSGLLLVSDRANAQ